MKELEKEIRNKLKPYFLGKYDVELDICVAQMKQLFASQTTHSLKEQKQQIRGKAFEQKRTMAHIQGAKRVETDYILLSDLEKLLED